MKPRFETRLVLLTWKSHDDKRGLGLCENVIGSVCVRFWIPRHLLGVAGVVEAVVVSVRELEQSHLHCCYCVIYLYVCIVVIVSYKEEILSCLGSTEASVSSFIPTGTCIFMFLFILCSFSKVGEVLSKKRNRLNLNTLETFLYSSKGSWLICTLSFSQASLVILLNNENDTV